MSAPVDRPPSWPWRLGAYALLLLVTVVVMFPVYAVVVMAVSRAPGFSVVLSPDPSLFTLEHLRKFLLHTDAEGRWLFGRQLLNSIVVAGGATALGVLLSTTAAYAFSRFRFPGHRFGIASFVIVQMFPATMMIVPLYLLLSALSLLDSILGLTLVYATTALPFCVWMLKGYFDTIPADLDEAALVDGASRLRIFYQIILPLARPAIAVTALFSFLTAWNEFVMAATFISHEESFTLPVVLFRQVGAYGADWGAFAAGSLLVSLPVCLVFFALQRQLVSGLASGAVK
jgi:arabinogalactan oligomer/maltooligosaccharide transport system permease protein